MAIILLAIAVVKQALDVDPTNLEMLHALGVSHANGLSWLPGKFLSFRDHFWVYVDISVFGEFGINWNNSQFTVLDPSMISSYL
ncbi:hypothetical protein E5676_scaffold343G00830 [Cucumis melo var. makuwa]|uniref:Uncharacterized protein n=1 Tax=Cucumis melo var. makuwa TaxID=1194695 RepID=A0A5D3E4B4_CUCMM|nr:hypothetical protein E5676_scaffold343G00830 [Cucumis melo var. makuwa]